MNLIKLAARGTALWLSGQCHGSLGPCEQGWAACCLSHSTTTLLHDLGIRGVCGRVWSCRPPTPLPTNSQPPQSRPLRLSMLPFHWGSL